MLETDEVPIQTHWPSMRTLSFTPPHLTPGPTVGSRACRDSTTDIQSLGASKGEDRIFKS